MIKKILISFISIISIVSNSSVIAKESKIENIIENILTNDSKFINKHSNNYFSTIKDKQNPSITLLTCSDSRIDENIFEEDPVNKIFSVRNIGNQFSTSIGSVDYGIKNLHTKLLIIMGHSHCGAINAAMSNYEDESFAIIRDIDHLFVPVRKIQTNTPKDKNIFEINWSKIIETNVDYQVLLASKKYEQEIKNNDLYIIGMVDDLTNIYNSGYGRTIIVNINNIKKVELIKSQKILSNLSNSLKSVFIKRLT